jgi:hypothetical protein
MTRKYYSIRNNPGSISIKELCWKVQNQYLYFKDKDYFKGKTSITPSYFPDSAKHEAAIVLRFQPFPIEKWNIDNITEDMAFDTIEYLYDKVSKPGNWTHYVNDDGYNYNDYDEYFDKEGRNEYRSMTNSYLCDYKTGYELSVEGDILTIGKDGLHHIVDAEIVPYDEANVDNKVRNAILKWRKRPQIVSVKKEAIRDMADVFEWLKTNKHLEKVLSKKDESDIFNIANNFSIRHHNPDQKSNYDKAIWYSWMFHFYLATYHAVIRLLIKNEKGSA